MKSLSSLHRSQNPLRCSILKRIHPVDKSLLIFISILLIQSLCNIFFPADVNQNIGSIDVVVRTSAAAIFGYFLSANFIHHVTGSSRVSSTSATHILKVGTNQPESNSNSTVQEKTALNEDLKPFPKSSATDPKINQENPEANCLQVVIATGIGLFCLITLLILRNLVQLNIISVKSDSVLATITQFRDFVSGCVGFLIGCPTHNDKKP